MSDKNLNFDASEVRQNLYDEIRQLPKRHDALPSGVNCRIFFSLIFWKMAL